MDDHYTADSLESYLKTIENISFNVTQGLHSPILYRGEARAFSIKERSCPSFGAKAFRRKNASETLESGDYFSLHKKLDSYRYEVWSDLDNTARDNFLAYAHHHGIDTNLIEVTKDPLIALFYAVADQSNTNGCVFIYDLPSIDITSALNKTDKVNIFDMILTDDPQEIDEFIQLTLGLDIPNPDFFNKHLYTLCQNYYCVLNNSEQILSHINQNEDSLIHMVNDIAQRDSSNYLQNLFNEKIRDHHRNALHFFTVLRGFIRMKKEKKSHIAFEMNGNIPTIYNPKTNFKKGLNQDNLYIYQKYITTSDHRIIGLEKIKPTRVIEIKNKNKILSLLNKLNINHKNVYGDHRMIAKYINRFYQYSVI